MTIPNALWVSENTLCGGQPNTEDFISLKNQNFVNVVSLRTQSEKPSCTEAEEIVTSLGLRFFSLPIEAPLGLNRNNVRIFNELLEKTNNQKTLIYCGSGNRVGALFALKAFWIDDQPKHKAIEIGKKNGLTALQKSVETIMKSSNS